MGLIPEEIIAQVIERSDIAEIIGEYVPLKKSGRSLKACCPFHHEKTPSFIVNRDKQIFHCFGCGVGGNVISFVMQHDHMDFVSALRILAQKCGVVVPETAGAADSGATRSLRDTILKINELAVEFFHKMLLTGQDEAARAAQDYLKRRRVTLSSVERLKLGFAPDAWEGLIGYLRGKGISLSAMEKAGLVIARDKGEGFYDRFRNRIIFPIFDVRGRSVAFGARAMRSEEGAKYINSPETALYVKREHLYGFHQAKQAVIEKDFVVVVEGYMDFLTPFQNGFENIVASLGTALTVEQVRLLRRYTHNVVVFFDADEAGQSATLRSLDLLVEEDMDVKVAVAGEGKDPDAFIQASGIESFRACVDEAQTLFDYKLKMLSRVYDRASVEGRARMSLEMLTTIAKYPNEIVKRGYVQKLSQALGVPEEALLTELRKIKTPGAAASGVEIKAATTPAVPAVARVVERNLLRLILEEEDMIPLVSREIAASDFQDAEVRPIMEQIFTLLGKQEKVSAATLINFFDEERIKKFLSELLAAQHPVAEDKGLLRQDYINRIKADRLKQERKNLCAEIQQAEADKDEERLKGLKERFNQIIKGLS